MTGKKPVKTNSTKKVVIRYDNETKEVEMYVVKDGLMYDIGGIIKDYVDRHKKFNEEDYEGAIVFEVNDAHFVEHNPDQGSCMEAPASHILTTKIQTADEAKKFHEAHGHEDLGFPMDDIDSTLDDMEDEEEKEEEDE